MYVGLGGSYPSVPTDSGGFPVLRGTDAGPATGGLGRSRLLRIYLDENKWIELSRARFGREPEAASYRELLALAEVGVKLGIVSFPLSHFHYIELRHPDPARRWRLATLMADLSRFHTIAPARLLLETEIDLALQKRFGAPEEARGHPLFGLGFGHASGDPDMGFWVRMKGTVLTPEDWFSWEKLILSRPPLNKEDYPSKDAVRVPPRTYHEAEQRVSAELQKMQVERDHMRDILTGLEVIDLLDPLLVATRRAGLPDGVMRRYEKEKEALTEFVRDLPTRDVPLAIQELRHENYQEVWGPNDLVDIGMMSVAIPYCDVVVVEKKMWHLARRAKLDTRYGTEILTDMSDLRDLLIDATAH
jgi:hypothetical protein